MKIFAASIGPTVDTDRVSWDLQRILRHIRMCDMWYSKTNGVQRKGYHVRTWQVLYECVTMSEYERYGMTFELAKLKQHHNEWLSVAAGKWCVMTAVDNRTYPAFFGVNDVLWKGLRSLGDVVQRAVKPNWHIHHKGCTSNTMKMQTVANWLAINTKRLLAC